MKAWAHRTNVALCTIFFFYQVSELSKKKWLSKQLEHWNNVLQAWMSLNVFLKHPTSRTRTRTRLSESGLPLIELCHTPGNKSFCFLPERNFLIGFKADFIESQGYASLSDYRIGRASNGSFIGWAGDQGLGTNEFFEQVYHADIVIQKNWCSLPNRKIKEHLSSTGILLAAPWWHPGNDHDQRENGEFWKIDRGGEEISGRQVLASEHRVQHRLGVHRGDRLQDDLQEEQLVQVQHLSLRHRPCSQFVAKGSFHFQVTFWSDAFNQRTSSQNYENAIWRFVQ